MKYIICAIALLAMSCSVSECEKAKEAYDKFAGSVIKAELVLNQAIIAKDAVCSIVTQNKKFELSKACEAAKKAMEVAIVALNSAKAFEAMYKQQMDLACSK